MKRTLLLIAVAILLTACGPSQRSVDKQVVQDRLAKAEAMFQERCKTAGEKIVRTVDNIEGIYLLKLRPTGINFGAQFEMDDPYGNDSGGETYLKTFFWGFYRNTDPPPKGYRYVEALDPKDGQRYRYTGSVRDVEVQLSGLSGGGIVHNTKFVLDRVHAPGEPPRYGVTYDDISTREDREYWIAGSSLKIIDLKTNEVIAERIGYMMDRGQGDRGGGRSPWLLAASYACPAFRSAPGIPPIQTDQTRMFVVKVLHPLQEK